MYIFAVRRKSLHSRITRQNVGIVLTDADSIAVSDSSCRQEMTAMEDRSPDVDTVATRPYVTARAC